MRVKVRKVAPGAGGAAEVGKDAEERRFWSFWEGEALSVGEVASLKWEVMWTACGYGDVDVGTHRWWFVVGGGGRVVDVEE